MQNLILDTLIEKGVRGQVFVSGKVSRQGIVNLIRVLQLALDLDAFDDPLPAPAGDGACEEKRDA
jgi:hypothetical protein